MNRAESPARLVSEIIKLQGYIERKLSQKGDDFLQIVALFAGYA